LTGTDSSRRILTHTTSQLSGACAHDSQSRPASTGSIRARKNPKTGRRHNLGTFASRAAPQKHERAVQFFKRG
jgi:hypothetical protein